MSLLGGFGQSALSWAVLDGLRRKELRLLCLSSAVHGGSQREAGPRVSGARGDSGV